MLQVDKMFGLEGKLAVVTGAGGVLCGAAAGALLQAGARLALWGRNLENLRQKVDEFARAGLDAGRCACFTVDLLDEAAIATALEQTVAAQGVPDILVNGVGGSSLRRPLLELERVEFEQVMNLNLLAGCILPAKHFAACWRRLERPGCIVNFASMGAFLPLSGGWAYSAAKAAVVNQTVAQARELAPYGIRVNAVAPGFFPGKQNRHLLLRDDGTPTARGARILAHTPLGRFGAPAELGPAVVFLAGPGAAFITGVTLAVDGGFLAGAGI